MLDRGSFIPHLSALEDCNATRDDCGRQIIKIWQLLFVQHIFIVTNTTVNAVFNRGRLSAYLFIYIPYIFFYRQPARLATMAVEQQY